MPLSLMMDIMITVLLAATIFYAFRLSRHLEAFRSNRSDMERLIRDLSSQITRAQEGITTLDDVARESSGELRKLVDRATGLSDELEIMTESGDKLATRLEALAMKNRELSDQMNQTSVNLVYPGGKAPVLKAERREPVETASRNFFAIRDPDFHETGMASAADEGDALDDDDSFGSSTERKLAAALRKRGKGDNG